VKYNRQNKPIGCEIDCGDKHEWFPCNGLNSCLCHQPGIQFGELADGCCSECGCPKTKEAFDRICGNAELRESHRRTFVALGGIAGEWPVRP